MTPDRSRIMMVVTTIAASLMSSVVTVAAAPTSIVPVRIACVGDSITQGARVEQATQSYPAVLQSTLGDGVVVQNFGIGGATLLRSGRPNVWQAVDRVGAFQPDVIIISLGTNDTVSGNRRNWENIEAFDSDYEELLKRFLALESKPQIIVCTPSDMVLSTEQLSEERRKNLEERRPRLLALCDRIRALVARQPADRVSLLELNSVLQNHPEWLSVGDGVHPNVAGYREISDAVAGKIHSITDIPIPSFPGTPGDWNSFRKFEFEVAGRPVLVVAPDEPAAGRPWVWHGEFFGHKPAPDIELLKRGFHVVYMRVPDMLGCPAAVQFWNEFYRELTLRYQLAPKAALVGLSRGGLYCYNWAIANPHKVCCIYGDAPVCDFRSWPGGRGKGKGSPRDWDLVLKVYGFASDADAVAWNGNPVDNLKPLVDAGVPLLHVYGDADDVVPWDENTGVVAERYRELGGHMTLIAKPGVGHHPHGLEDSTPIVEFIQEAASRLLPRAGEDSLGGTASQADEGANQADVPSVQPHYKNKSQTPAHTCQGNVFLTLANRLSR
ncbi:MAG: hypothetical protein KDA96_06475 [Planctomycetaceae bacterium]|nr:hypothetical protein [Planctomycetaceae bacterium]